MADKKEGEKNTRWYFLRTGAERSEEISLSLFGGISRNRKPFSSLEREGEKAWRAGYSRLLLAWNFVFHPEKDKLARWASEKPQLFALSAHKKSWPEFKKTFEKYQPSSLFIDCFLESYDAPFLDDLESRGWPFQITIPAHRGVNLKRLSENLSKRYKRKNLTSPSLSSLSSPSGSDQYGDNTSLFPSGEGAQNSGSVRSFSLKAPRQKKPFDSSLQPKGFPPVARVHFPFSHKQRPELYSSEEMYAFLKSDFHPPPLADIYNLSIPEDLKLEPELEPEFVYRVSSQTPIASVIIPSYNCSRELSLTLEHLFRQDLAKAKWEAIVVDDCSDDSAAQTLKSLDFLSRINFKFVFLPGQRKRDSFADHRFRAGIARNQGVKQAQGKYLLFLDSDILTPPFYLSSACRQLEKYDVIQHPRYHLTPSAPTDYSQIDKSRHTFIKGSGYWEEFYSSAKNWSEKKLAWKYISTNTLGLKASAFKRAGRFRVNHTCYGFEDTDLGYRLYKAGFRFKLNPIDTYHLFRSSEPSDSDILKRKLVGLSAKIFFHNSHCLEGYEEFRHMMPNNI